MSDNQPQTTQTAKPDKRSKRITTATAGAAGTLSFLGLTMLNVTMIASIGNDVQEAFYGLSSVTFFAIGAIFFFIPCGLMTAEMASGWSQRGGVFRWVGEAFGKGPAFLCLAILWAQLIISFGSGLPSSAATIGFFSPDLKWAINFAESPHYVIWITLGFMAFYWILAWLATKGVKLFARITTWGVLTGTFIPLGVMIILAIVWLAQGHQPNISFAPKNLLPQWTGLGTLAMVSGVFFSYAGIEMNAAYIKQLKDPKKEFPGSIMLSMVLCFIIFVVGTLIIAIVIPENQINLLYTLVVTMSDLGATIGMPWLYLVFTYTGLLAMIASVVTNLAGPSFMLGQTARSGFLPPALQSNNKHGMPSRLIYIQMAASSAIAFLFLLVPNIEGFVIMITQAMTILYMVYYVIMFSAYIKLKYDQPNRPRSFVVPGGKFGAWVVAICGIASALLGIFLSFIPPTQLSSQVGSGVNYVVIIACIVIGVIVISLGTYWISTKKKWVDPTNKFSPFTWEIEGLKGPRRVLSDVPSDVMAAGQNPMGTPIIRPYDPNAKMADLIAAAKSKGATDEEIQKTIINPPHTPAPAPSKNAGPEPPLHVRQIALKSPVTATFTNATVTHPKAHPYYTPDEMAQVAEHGSDKEDTPSSQTSSPTPTPAAASA